MSKLTDASDISLVADIGGTNARFALVADASAQPLEPKNLCCAEYPTIVDALTTLIPAEVIRLEWRERLVPYWSLNEVDIELSAVVSRQSPAQLTVFDQELEMIQPLRLTVEARTADVSETEVRDFIVAARFGLGFDQDWNWQVIELEPARLLGFG